MVMTSAAVMVATAVTVLDSVIQIHGQHLLNWEGWCSGMDFNTQLCKHLHGILSQTSTQHIRTALGCKEAGHGSVLMLWRLHQDGFRDLSVFNCNDSYLWGLTKMRPQHSLIGGNGNFLILFHCYVHYHARFPTKA